MASQSTSLRDYNKTLRKLSNSLQNALDTFGPASRQYLAVLEILKNCLRDIEDSKRATGHAPVVDDDMLSTAMGYLEIRE
ncbi:hypothetical protein N7492_001771 [Penicillium capsulatum]|uniref:Uncharacterized protein n=1 Tax=Penicillium capsulatum TaxID=69766 RepID=A0A9W9IWB5_9EURO|nr:hypothetical protein N7492_001771 [Penicillium capsulatum]KAJ6129179.1 hypothetical protein N7512_001959 [Penicillium capsulatum]